MKMGRDGTEFDTEQEKQLQGVSARLDSEAGGSQPINSSEKNGQEPDTAVYRDDPRFRDLLLDFQNGAWDKCLEKIEQLLLVYPEDKPLLAFKQDVEIRLRQQKNSQAQQAEANLKRRKRLGLRTLIIAALGLLVLGLVVWMGNIYQAKKLEQEATLTKESLAAQLELADGFMQAGKPEEALRLYSDIQKIDPLYEGIDQKIQLARESMTVADLYQQGVQALKDGKNDQALEILQKVEELHPKYKDTLQLIQQIQQKQQISTLVEEIQNSYTKEDWTQVVHDYEAIQAIDPTIQLPELKEVLFNSYRKLILDIARRTDLTAEDLEKAENYYRNALALFPQSKEYSKEREELQKIAVELLANKYYLDATSLLESSNYSIEGLQQSIRILNKASEIGPDAPAIKAGIEKAQLFLDSYNNLLQFKWDDAISGFESLYRKEENYADGRVKYFLYEAYIARGDAIFAFADFEGAFLDYQQAEKFAWAGEGNPLRVFQSEVRIAAALHKLERMEEAAEFYHYAFDRMAYQSRLTNAEEQDLLNTLSQADAAYKSGNDPEAIRLYEIALKQKEKLYDQKRVTVNPGDTLVNIAFQNDTTLESLRAENSLDESMIISKVQELVVPVIAANGQ